MEDVWPEARTFLFEANEDMAPFYDHYGWEDYHIGLLSDADHTKRNYYYNEENIGGNSYYKENTGAYPSDIFRVLNTETLDKVVADKGWPHPQLMKLDVQGAECDILKGSPKVLESVEWLIVELQHINYNEGALLAADSIALIQSLGFELIDEKFASSDLGIDADYGIDEDDSETLALLPALRDLLQADTKPGAWELKEIVSRHRGYHRLHEYYNDLAAISTGKLLALWNDDVLMVTSMWDFYLAQELAEGGENRLMWIPQEICYKSEAAYPFQLLSGGFPIIHRKAYEAMGHFSQSPLNDKYLHDVMGRFAGFSHDRSYLSRVMIHHDNTHATNSEVAKPLLSQHFEAPIQQHIQADREALRKNGLV